jgi:hypothetical protein
MIPSAPPYLAYDPKDGRKHEGPICPEGAQLVKPDSAAGRVSRPSRPWRSRWAEQHKQQPEQRLAGTRNRAKPNSAEGCDHRGAGYTAFMLAGFATSGADVMPYVFEPFANGGSERCDMLENSLGLFTRHGLPKSTAAAHWAIDQMGWRSRWAA